MDTYSIQGVPEKYQFKRSWHQKGRLLDRSPNCKQYQKTVLTILACGTQGSKSVNNSKSLKSALVVIVKEDNYQWVTTMGKL